MAEKIKKALQSKCGLISDYYFAIGKETQSLPLTEQFECILNAVGKASMMNDMTDEWKQFQPKFNHYLNAWKQCKRVDGKIETLK